MSRGAYVVLGGGHAEELGIMQDNSGTILLLCMILMSLSLISMVIFACGDDEGSSKKRYGGGGGGGGGIVGDGGAACGGGGGCGGGVADLCRRKEVHLHLQSSKKSIRAAGVAPLLQTRDAHNVFDEMPKPPGLGAASAVR
ncbi:hypothetical protein L3X38_017346 [Prunus dulcis]|uniref:Uncharacterized protein n=1 Tax=Prunus dulcis TaxID=3755 RepID=A0AAD4W6Z0_PRUDU|nr:hypothetical protein L3X38_017346 [Prunus dulcis]